MRMSRTVRAHYQEKINFITDVEAREKAQRWLDICYNNVWITDPSEFHKWMEGCEAVLQGIGQISVEDIDGLLAKLEARGVDMEVDVDVDRLTDNIVDAVYSHFRGTA